MDEHVYLMAQFQYLEFETQIFPSSETVLIECEKWISEKEGDTLRGISLSKNPDSKIGIVKAWETHREGILEEVSQWRSGKRTNLAFLKDDFEKMNPLEREIHLLKIHWEWLNERTMAAETNIDFSYLVLYLLRVKILEHKRKFNAECGMMHFKKYNHASWGGE